MPSIQFVDILHLKANMKILAFTGFTEQYRSMNEKICQFVKHNFKGATAHIVREGKQMEVIVEDISPGDTLKKIANIPESRAKITHVTSRLVPELKKRGFTKFEVTQLPKKTAPKDEKKAQSIENVNKLVEKVKESIETRERATEAIKDVMDKARSGKASAAEVKQSVDEIVGDSSTEAIEAVASLKQSDQTYAHCVDAGAIFSNAYYKIKKRKGEKGIFTDPGQALFGAFMHDFGKAKVPKEILESTVRFARDSKEMNLMQSHPVFGAELLSGMSMPDYIVNMAHYHHVKMDTSLNSSYPQNVNYDDVLMETRLVSIVDVYQALIGRRSYKKSWPPAAAIRYIDALAGVEFDMDVWDDFVAVVGTYPVGSLVELSDSNLAFVMTVPEEDLEKPQVVVVCDSEGNELKNKTFIDLADEQEITIVKDVDHYDILGDDRALEIFTNIQAR